MHKEIDIAGPIGTPIFAAADGIVTYAGWNEGGYGNQVEITPKAKRLNKASKSLKWAAPAGVPAPTCTLKSTLTEGKPLIQ